MNFEAQFPFQIETILNYFEFSFLKNISRKHIILKVVETFISDMFVNQNYKYDNFLSKIGVLETSFFKTNFKIKDNKVHGLKVFSTKTNNVGAR